MNVIVSNMERLGKDLFPNTKSTSEIQMSLAELGIEYLESPSSFATTRNPNVHDKDEKFDDRFLYISSEPQKVPGCIATVYLQSTLIIPKQQHGGQAEVQITGTSDAHISRGLLALLCRSIMGVNIDKKSQILEDLLDVNPSKISEYLQIQSALSVGRNDGLANMMNTIQQQIRDLRVQQDQVQSDQPSAGETTTANSMESQAQEQPEGDNKRQPTAALLLSGGVDSSVALHLLLEQGYNVTAFYLKIWLEDELSHLGTCPWEEDIEICQQVCKQAHVPLISVSLQSQYHERVMSHTIHEAAKGRTPSPDILCNSRIKFGTFLDMMEERYNDDSNRFDVIASGHYAQVRYNASTDRYQLFRAPDPVKDQSYFLCALDQNQLSRLAFPIGNLEKSQVRYLADNKFKLPNRHRADSQGLCFLGKLKFSDFLSANLGAKPGPIVDALNGNVIGEHDGVWYHTVGQRKGLGPYLHPLATSQGPWYVVAKDPGKDVVYASNQYDQEVFEQTRSECYVEDIHWIAGNPPRDASLNTEPLQLQMKIRHGPRLVSGTLEMNVGDEGSNSTEGRIKLDTKDGGLAAGQYVVFYNDEAECLGGGIISERHWTDFLSKHRHEQVQQFDPIDASKVLRVRGTKRKERERHPELQVVGLDDDRKTIRSRYGGATDGGNKTSTSWTAEVQ